MSKIKLVLSDFDGTLTSENKIGPQFLEVLSFLEQKNIDLVVVTGRSLSWAHFLLTHYKMKAVIAEGGGVLVYQDLKKEVFCTSEDLRKLEYTVEDLLEAYPHLQLSEDSFGRLCDRAIELELLKNTNSLESVQKFLSSRCYHSCSNVHLNFWTGNISKEKASLYYLERNNLEVDEVLYFGDAPNDEGMFKYFPSTVGVSNIAESLSRIKHKPNIILEGKRNEGACGVLNYLKSIL